MRLIQEGFFKAHPGRHLASGETLRPVYGRDGLFDGADRLVRALLQGRQFLLAHRDRQAAQPVDKGRELC